ncbi:MAG: YggU family protein [Bdellovibrio sp.]|nr:MAG: YggU family protein [Bdellovibrio sp.]
MKEPFQVELLLHVQPKASKTQVVGEHGERLKVKVQAPPVDGAANEALIKFFSKKLKIAKKQICLTHGETSREKTLLFDTHPLPASEFASKIINLVE